MENEISGNDIQLIRKNRGGARPGAGRKKVYESKYDFKRLKCRSSIANHSRTCITIIDALPEKELEEIFCAKMNGGLYERKGANSRTWTEADCFSSPWNITVNEEYDERIFALAFIFNNPEYVRIDWMNHDGTVQLRWQRANEIASLMMAYGNLMARKNRLRTVEKDVLDEIPLHPAEIMEYISEKLYC